MFEKKGEGPFTSDVNYHRYFDEDKLVWVPCDQPSPDPQEGRKFDKEKPRVDLLPGDALIEIGKVLAHGAKKYDDRNWELGMDWNRPFGALLRHLWAWWGGEDIDEDSGLHHLAHAGCNVLFLLTYTLRNTGKDTRSFIRR